MPRAPYYTEIADAIEALIHQGKYPPGAKLPTAIELANDYGVGGTTIAKAIALLRDRGVVYSDPPRGVFVVDKD